MSPAAVPPIGARLRAERQRRGLTIRSLAREIGVSPSLISQVETGKSSPSVSTLYAMTSALEVSIEDLFDGRDGTAAPAPPERVRRDGHPEHVRLDGHPERTGRDGHLKRTGRDGPGEGPGERVARPQPAVPHRQRRVGPVVRSGEREALVLDSGVSWELLGRLPGAHVDFLLITYQPGGASSSSGLLMRHPGTEYGYLISGRLTLALGFEKHRLAPGDAVSFDSTTPHGYVNDGVEPAVGVWFVVEHG